MKGLMMNLAKIFIKIVAILNLTVLLFVIVRPTNSFAEMSVNEYCQLTIVSIKNQINHLQELVSLSDREENPGILSQKEKKIKAEFDQKRKSLYASYNTTEKEYALYKANFHRKIEKYLSEHPDIKDQISELASKRNALFSTYESAKR